MAHHIQSSFSAGELDPALHERTGFDKYQSGLKTLRNTVIGKTGRMISRAGKMHFLQTRDATAVAGTFTAAVTDICTKAGHVYGTGTLVTLTNSGGALPAGLSAATDYYVIWLTKDTFSLATSLANAEAGTAVNITGTGTGTHTITPTSVGDKRSIIYSPFYSNYVLELGHRYIRVHNVIDGGYLDEGHAWTEDDLDYIQFTPTQGYVYICRAGTQFRKFTLATAIFVQSSSVIYGLAAPTLTASASTGNGYLVEYVCTYVLNGEESLFSTIVSGAGIKLPVAAAEVTSMSFATGTDLPNSPTEFRLYRRPALGTAFGFVAAIETYSWSLGLAATVTFNDHGTDADYTNSPPSLSFFQDYPTSSPIYANPRTICIYQQRLLLTEFINEEAIHASRTAHFNNFYRDYPLGADSTLTFKCGTSGNAKVLHLLDNGGLLAFTTVGIYQSTGALSPDNLSMDKKGNWVIEETVPPLEVPGGLLFVDKSTNTIRSLIFSNEAGGFPGEEVSIFSNHLFENKTIRSWAFQDGDIPLIWVVMDDGSLNALTYQREHQMQAWSRHDTSDGLYESVAVQKNLDAKSEVYFIVNRNGTRYIEYGADRFVSDIKDFVCMDSATTFKSEITETGAVILGVRPDVTVTAASIDDWTGSLTLTSDVAIFANSASNGAVGTVFRFFDSEGSAVDLTVTTYTSTTIVVVTPSCEFPSSETESITLYRTYTELTGLTHLAEKQVSILSDGYVLASPLNNIDGYPEVTVTPAGTITLPEGQRGAIIHVGLPFASDIETLDIDTVEQKPTLVESMIVNRIMMKVLNSRGLYIGSSFPVNDYVEGMTDAENRVEDFDLGNIGNAAQALTTKRLDLAIDNDWQSQGRVCIRQVDPLPFEILSIIPDLTVQWRR